MNPFRAILIFLVQVYRLILSPAKVFLFGPTARCRYMPSCSEYAIAALSAHGVFRGTWLAAGRVCRCHPWGGCGHDPVPLESAPTRSANSLDALSALPR
ncbi:MAG: membrane protein insertion efficiency factor YidD [Pedosphaera sp.]|nr:membrane protein insertion efficiency factor YidD [Pedosphaera sp.]